VECDFRLKRAVLFFQQPFGGLGATYNDHLRLIEKHVVDFLLVFIELFSLGVMAEALWASIGSKSVISLGCPKISGRRGFPPPTILLLRKLGENDLSYGIKICTDLSSVLSQCTRLTDRQTDTFLIASLRWHSVQPSALMPCSWAGDRLTVSLAESKNKLLLCSWVISVAGWLPRDQISSSLLHSTYKYGTSPYLHLEASLQIKYDLKPVIVMHIFVLVSLCILSVNYNNCRFEQCYLYQLYACDLCLCY